MKVLGLGRTGSASMLLVLVVVAGAIPTVPARAAGAALEVVGRQALGSRGMNAALAVAGTCAWVGSRNDAPVQVVDIADPASPRLMGSLPGHPGSTPRELRAVPSAHLLVVLYYRASRGPNRYDIFHWDTDCGSSVLVGHWDFGASSPHEFYLWQDPDRPARVLLYTTMFGSVGQGLQVLDISSPAAPELIGGWSVPTAYGHAPVHSVALSRDGRTAYVALWTGGLVVADVSDFAGGKPGPALRPLTPPGATFRTTPGNVHSAVALDGGTRLLTTDERYPAPFGAGCPFGSAHIVDIQDPARPVAVATMAVSENQASACATATRGTWTSHNATLTAHLGFVTWYSAGLEVFQLDDPVAPLRVAELRPSGVAPTQRDLQLGDTDTMSWSYPVIRAGLIYLVDINQGLLVLRYSGPHQDELAGFAEGNSNIASPAALPAPSATSPPSPAGAPVRPAPRPVTVVPRSTNAAPGWEVGLLLAAVVTVVVAAVVAARRRRRSP